MLNIRVQSRAASKVKLAMALGGFSCAVGLLITACRVSDRPPANLLLITLDTVRADRLSCYGYGRDTTPVLNALAADGCLFERVEQGTLFSRI